MANPFDAPTHTLLAPGKPGVIVFRKYKLQVGKEKPQVVDRRRVTIGTTGGCDVVVTDKAVSRVHCEIMVDEKGYLLRDLDSKNGTVLDGVRVVAAYLKPNSVIQLGDTRIRAPFAGIVTARNIDVGSLISATGGGLGSGVSGAALPSTGTSQGGEMFRVAQIDRLRLFVSVPEVYAPYVTVGEAVNCFFDAVGRTPFEGKVTRTANAVDPTTRTLLTEVQLPNPDGALLPGMYTRAVFVHLRAEPPIIVPSDSIIARANGISIAVVQDGMVHIRKATIGRDYGAQTEVLGGINAGDLVIINPTDAAQEGARVNAHELKEGRQAGATTSGQQSAAGQNQQGTPQPSQGQPDKRQRGRPQNAQPLNPEKNVPLTKGPEPGAPGELQGPGPIINPQPPYGASDVPQQNSGTSGTDKAKASGGAGSTSSGTQPH